MNKLLATIFKCSVQVCPKYFICLLLYHADTSRNDSFHQNFPGAKPQNGKEKY